MQTKTERLSWHSEYFFGRESSVSQLKYCFSVLLISWLGPEKPGTRQPLSSLPLAYHHLLVCLFSPFSLFHALAFKPFISPPFIPILSVYCICRPRSRGYCFAFYYSAHRRKSPSRSESDRRNPAVHSRRPLLLLAVSRPTW